MVYFGKNKSYGCKINEIKMLQEIRSYFDYVLPLVKESGKVLLEAKDFLVETKEEDYDLVTVYDRKIEEILIRKIKERYPEHKFIGEEESSAKQEVSKLSNDPTWIIDPIDGTANFVRDFHISCISIGLTINKEQVLGIAYNPFTQELFTAIKGQGAYLNGKRIYTSGQREIGKSVMAYELSLAKSKKLRDMYLYRLKHLINAIQGIRSFGSAVMSLCYVACGVMDAYQCDGLYPWDAAAGVLIVREAGGHVCDSNGKEFDLMDPNFLATATKQLSDQFMDIERKADDEMIQATKAKYRH